MEPTPAGALLYQRAKAILRGVQLTEQAISGGVDEGRDHAFAAELQHLLDQSDRATRQIHYTAPTESDDLGAFDRTGRVGAAELAALPSAAEADFMLCGPTRFMAEIRAGLEEHGIHADRIHAETFGPSAPAVDGATSTAAP